MPSLRSGRVRRIPIAAYGGRDARDRYHRPHRADTCRRSRTRSSPGPGTSAGPSGCSSATRASGPPTRDVQATIAERLGWLDAPGHFHGEIGPLEAFGEAIRDAGFTTAIVGGMGGSSLAPEVLQQDVRGRRRLAPAADPRLDRPGRGRGDRRRPLPARDAVHRGDEVGHDGRAARLPGRRLGPDRGGASRRATSTSSGPATSWPRSPTRAGASRRSPITTSSARSSSTRPTSAGGTPR